MSGRRGPGSASLFSSHDIWLDLSEVERDEWRGYFDRMLGWLHHFGYTPERNPCSMLLEGSTTGTEFSKRGSAVTRKAAQQICRANSRR
jgi:hypothetical protein